jgi:hypothetical protein
MRMVGNNGFLREGNKAEEMFKISETGYPSLWLITEPGN